MVGSLERMIMDGFYRLMKVRSWLSHQLAIHQMICHCYSCSNGGLSFCVVIRWTFLKIFLNHYVYFVLQKLAIKCWNSMSKTECPHPRGAKWKEVVVVGQVIEPLENLNL